MRIVFRTFLYIVYSFIVFYIVSSFFVDYYINYTPSVPVGYYYHHVSLYPVNLGDYVAVSVHDVEFPLHYQIDFLIKRLAFRMEDICFLDSDGWTSHNFGWVDCNKLIPLRRVVLF